MSNENKAQAAIIAINALAEMAGCLRDALITNGFTRTEACFIVSAMVSETISQGKAPTNPK
jgi:hypothetical protein